MDPVSLVVSTLGTSAWSVLSEATKQRLKQMTDKNASIKIGDDVVELSELDLSNPRTVEVLERIAAGPKEPRNEILDQLRAGSATSRQDIDPQVAGAALSWSSAVFADARRRIALVFRLHLCLAIALAVILFGGIAGAIVSGLMGQNSWALVFGGVSVADLLGVYALKPASAITSAVVASQKLEAIHMRLHDQLEACGSYDDIDKRIECQTAVWNAVLKELGEIG